MAIAIYISSLIMPLVILAVVVYGMLEKVDIYNVFVKGAKEGILTVYGILPTLIGLLCAVAVLRESGALAALGKVLSPIAEPFGFPQEVIPLSLMKAFSSSGATGLLTDIYKTTGPDSFSGRVASVMMCSTETIIYTMSVYFMSIGIKNTRYTFKGAVFANLIGVIGSFFVVIQFFGR